MLVGSCLEVNVIALFSLVACDRVCQYDLVGVSDMRFAGCIGDRSGNVIWFLTVCTHGLIPPVFYLFLRLFSCRCFMLLHLYKWILALSEPLRGRLRQPTTSHKCAFWAHSCLLFNRTFLRSFLSNKKSPSLIIKDESPRVTTLNSAVPRGHRPHRLSKTA